LPPSAWCGMLRTSSVVCPSGIRGVISPRSVDVIQFPDCFLLLFGELAFGGFLCLSVPPFHEIERGFYKSSAAVFLSAAAVMAAGKSTLLVQAGSSPLPGAVAEAVAWSAFTAVAAVYLYSLWGDPYRLRARAYVLTLGTGLAALWLSAARFPPPAVAGPIAAALYVFSFGASAGVLGASVTGMLLGHWYLIDTGMSLRPLERVLRTFVTTLACQLLAMGLVLVVLATLGGSGAAAVLEPLWRDHRALLVSRIALGPLAALIIAAMITRTLAIPQTMAATGLFYIAVLAVAVGEMLSRLILLRTALPL